jgi:hypothetical protein
MPRQIVTALRLYPPGVWDAPFLVNDRPGLIAVDRRGNIRKYVKLVDGMDVTAVIRGLEEFLEQIDPAPKLQLVKGAPPPPDPYGYEDHLDWAMRSFRERMKHQRRWR